MITVVGLGYSKEDLSFKAYETIKNAKTVFVRTAETNAGKNVLTICPDARTFDSVYESVNNFDELNEKIKTELLSQPDCVFCVDGAGGDDRIVCELSKTEDVSVICGVSIYSLATSIYPDVSVEVKNATDIVSAPFTFASDSTLVIKEIDYSLLASDLKLKLLDAYGEINCYLVTNGKPKEIALVDLDREKKYDYSTFAILPHKGFLEKTRYTISDLYSIVYALVAPDGCPWDKVQTHKTIRDCCLEEAYELVEAIELEDLDKMVEESGDVLLQAIFHSNIAERTGEYTLNDVITGVCKKLVGRHLHIFASEKATNPEEALDVWEKAKAMEKSQNTFTDKMEQVALTLPALTRAGKIQKISEKMGFTQDSVQYWLDNINEEINEFLENKSEEEAGDVLYAVVRLIRSFGLNPELSLMTTTRKMIGRFEKMEKVATERNLELKKMTREQVIALYDEVKNG